MCTEARSVARLRVVLVVASVMLTGAATAGGEVLLVEAVRDRDAKAVTGLLKQHADVNTPQPDGATALHWAAHWDDLAIAEQLIRAGANVHAANDLGITPLFVASTDASPAMIDLLLRAGANPNTASPAGETALMATARTAKLEAAKALLARGADVNTKESFRGQTALMWAAAEQQLDMVRTLIDHGADVDARSAAGHTALLIATRTGDIPIASLLLDRGADVNAAAANGTTPLLVATVRGQVPLAMFLLNRGANPNADGAGYTPLHWASSKWQSTMTPFFQSAPVAGELFWLPQSGRVEMIKALLAHGADPNARLTKDPPRYGTSIMARKYLPGGTPFYLAALTGDTHIMRLLLANGADPLTPSKNETTPLMAAAGMQYLKAENVETERDHLEAVVLTLALGGDVNAVNGDGDTALHGIAFNGLDSIAQLVLDRGAKVNVKNNDGVTPLRVAEGSEFVMMIYVNDSTAALLRKAGGISEPQGKLILRGR